MQDELSVDGSAQAVHLSEAEGAFDCLPVGLFGSVMGMTGVSVAWRLAHEHFGVWIVISRSFGALAVVAFLAVSSGYIIKAVRAPHAVRAEFAHPIASNLFATILISLVLLPIVIVPFSLALARTIWTVGAIATTLFAWFVVSRWMSVRQQATSATPSWLVPVVGMLNMPLAMPSLGLTSMREVMVLSLAIGLFFTLPLFTMIFYRLLFEAPLPDELQPSLLILLAPFAVGTSTYIVTTGRTDLFAMSLFVLTLFMLTVLLGRLRHLGACCPFRISWWSVSFPIAASSIAGMRIASALQSVTADAIAIALLAAATVVIALLLVRTLWGVAHGELRKLSE